MSDWTPLREFLTADIAAQLDDVIAREADPVMQRVLAEHREMILRFAVDQAELIALRQAVAEREQPDAPDVVH
jgi:hypothetical protein